MSAKSVLILLAVVVATAAVAVDGGGSLGRMTADAPVWPKVAPGYIDESAFPCFTIKGEYFKGSLVSAADDGGQAADAMQRTKRSFMLRRKFTLPSEPAQAFLQGYGDQTAVFRLNGQEVFTYKMSYEPWSSTLSSVAEVTPRLVKGENILEIDYTQIRMYEGGAVAELLVRCADGSTVRIDTDDAFESSSDGVTWKSVKCLPPAPHSPRIKRMTYRDFEHPRAFFGGGPSKRDVRAGERITLGYTFGGAAPKGVFFVRVAVKRGASVYWNEEIEVGPKDVTALGADKWRLDIPFEVPLYIHSGTYEIAVDSNSLYCPSADTFGGALAIAAPAAVPGYEKPIRAEMKQVNGAPVVHLDGKPLPLYWSSVQTGKRPDRRADNGGMPFNVVTVQSRYTDWHPAFGKWDFSYYDNMAENYRRANPGAYFIWDILIYPPYDFAKRHPDQMACDEDGDIESCGRFSWSWASPQAMAELREMVDRALDYLESSPWANRIIGYRVNSGVTTEWLGWNSRRGKAKDCSAVSREAFRAYAAEHYPDLRDPHVPNVAERSTPDSPDDILWDQQKHMNAIAYMDFNSWIIVNDLLDLNGRARAILNRRGRRKLIGTYYGYTWFLNGNGGDQYRGHFALKHLLENNNGVLDFLCSPNSYSPRNLGDTCGFMLPFATLHANGILAVNEDDTRTHNQFFPTWEDFNQTHNSAQTRAVIARNDAIALCHQTFPYHLQLCNGMDLDSPECAEVGRDILKVMNFRFGREGGRDAKIALVASERSITAFPGLKQPEFETGYIRQDYQADGSVRVRPRKLAVLDGEIGCGAQERFARSGATYDLMLAEDLKDNPGDYSLYVFYNLFKYDEATLAAVEELRARGATLVWIYAPGWFNGNSLESMKRLTGMTFKEVAGGAPAVTLKADGRTMGQVGATVARRFSPVDADVVLGTYENGEVGLAAKKVGRSVAFFSGAWQFDLGFMRLLAKRTGAHVYVDTDDPIDADSSLFTLHARWPGRKTVRLPRKTDAIVDVFGKRIVARDADTFSFDADLHSTHLFYFGEDGDKLLEILKETK